MSDSSFRLNFFLLVMPLSPTNNRSLGRAALGWATP